MTYKRVFDDWFFLTAHKTLKEKTFFSLCLLFIIFFGAIMAWSSATASLADQSTFVILLNLKPGQNIILDLDSSLYNETLRLMIECLRFSPLAQALTMAESFPLVHLSKAYSSITYIQDDDIITYKIATSRTSINKPRFRRMLVLDSSECLVNPDSISSTDLINMFYQISYIGDISLLSKFRVSNLALMWNGLFTLLFKSFSERVAHSDSASKVFNKLIYCLYHWINLEYGSILWTQLIQRTSSTTRNTAISYARFFVNRRHKSPSSLQGACDGWLCCCWNSNSLEVDIYDVWPNQVNLCWFDSRGNGSEGATRQCYS